MNIRSTKLQPPPRQTPKPVPAVIIAREDSDQAVEVTGSDLDTLLDRGGMTATEKAVLLSTFGSALGSQAGLPLQVFATGLRNNALFDRAMTQSLGPGDKTAMIGAVCEIGKAVSKAAGFPTTGDMLGLGSKLAFVLAEHQGEIWLAERGATVSDEAALAPFADRVQADG